MNCTQQVSVDTSKFRVIAATIGRATTIPDWPKQNLDGLIQALTQWTLCPSASMHDEDKEHPQYAYSRPYRGLCWGNCRIERIGKSHRRRYVGTVPIHPEHPHAVRFCGNFLNYSFGFSLDTDDEELIELLDKLIEQNMQRPEYLQAQSRSKRSKA